VAKRQHSLRRRRAKEQNCLLKDWSVSREKPLKNREIVVIIKWKSRQSRARHGSQEGKRNGTPRVSTRAGGTGRGVYGEGRVLTSWSGGARSQDSGGRKR